MKYKLVCILFFIFANSQAQKFENIALTPPMGWNSWNTFKCDDVNENVIKETADAMVSRGLKSVGYEYIVIDDCWQIGRDENGYIIVDKEKFPSGIKALADYIHSKGLKFGIYSDAGTHTCGGRPGSKDYELKDAEKYAEWGVDYLKYDWCNTEGQDVIESYTLMRDALYKNKRPVLFSICEWGINKPWEWAKDVGHMWRTTYDINFDGRFDGDRWGNQIGWSNIIDKQVGLEKYAGPGQWNDPDMLAVGIGMPINESRAHFTMWCMLAAPLMTGNDIRNMDEATREILTHKNLIAIDQDKLGKQGFKIFDDGHFEIWQKPLSNGEIAICLFNRDTKTKNYELTWEEIKIKEFEGKYDITDVWQNNVMGNTESKISLSIPGRDVILFKLTPAK